MCLRIVNLFYFNATCGGRGGGGRGDKPETEGRRKFEEIN